ncbi:MAG: hypothetical protein JXP34_25410, partial [Planctomycetes bacterium]|nr:hypothetical protein [Planctomycetota bacterium]
GLAAAAAAAAPAAAAAAKIDWSAIPSPRILTGDAVTAYRDPAAVFHDGVFHLYYTLVRTEEDGKIYSYTATSTSRDLVRWSAARILTPKDRSLNYSSPGDVVRIGGEWILCLQTYPRPRGQKYGDATARIWTMRSRDLETWGAPELLRVKGPEVPVDAMGRMIDPYLIEDKDEPGKWWCFFKQNGASRSWSRDLRTWTFAGSTPAGENVCVIVDRGEYVMFHSPSNGIGVKRSKDLRTWRDAGHLTLGQAGWSWAREGRLTAGFVLDLRREPRVGKAILFFHASERPESETFDTRCHLGIAWSEDIERWEWPGTR